MPHEEREDFRRAETLVPPTESTPPPAERDTLPPDPPAEEAAAEAELARVGDTLRPPQRRTEPPKSGSFEEAARLFGENLIEMRETRREIAAGFTSHGAHLGIIETEVRRVNARLTGLEGDIVDVRSEMRREIASLRKRLDELERKAGSA